MGWDVFPSVRSCRLAPGSFPTRQEGTEDKPGSSNPHTIPKNAGTDVLWGRGSLISLPPLCALLDQEQRSNKIPVETHPPNPRCNMRSSFTRMLFLWFYAEAIFSNARPVARGPFKRSGNELGHRQRDMSTKSVEKMHGDPRTRQEER